MATSVFTPDHDSPPSKPLLRPQTASIHRIPTDLKPSVPVVSTRTLTRPKSAATLSPALLGNAEISGLEDERGEWVRVFKEELGGVGRTYSRTELGARMPGSAAVGGNWRWSRPGSARVSHRNSRPDLPPSTLQAIKRRIQPPVKFNDYTLIQAMALVAPYAQTLKSGSSTFSQREIQAIAHSKSVETFLQVVTGKGERRPGRCHKPPLARPWYRSKASLLDGNPYSESHTQAEKEAKEVMDNLHKRFTRTEQLCKGEERAGKDRESTAEESKTLPSTLAAEPGKSTAAFEVVGVGNTRIRPMSASILRAPTASRKEREAEKRVAFHPAEVMLPSVGDEELNEPREKKWELVKGKSVELDVPEFQPKQHPIQPSKSVKTLRTRLVSAESRGKALPRSSTLL